MVLPTVKTFLVHGLLPVRAGKKTTSSPGLTIPVVASRVHVTNTLADWHSESVAGAAGADNVVGGAGGVGGECATLNGGSPACNRRT